ncbi:helix-turn-helix domain-containing protein [Vagococcus silagei]|uniref:Mga helix-turn-helix domain-containing protein n=1 Tax=Vagococcus silagei TaxID=2508885 RepID=A0A4S3B374_9ENTE|nr:helix-turn-helix domain-containing protein [Vagococcus silagei]THB61511.1 hypothetical protein ESZ54_04645 [Vagococcus silagei]
MLGLSNDLDLQVLYLISGSEVTSLKELADSMGVSTRSIKLRITRLNETINDCFGIEKFIVSSHKGDIYFDSLYDYQTLNIFNKVQTLHLRKSHRFNLIILFSEYFKLTRQDICDKLFVSPSYLNKIIKSLNDQAEKYNLKIVNQGGYYLIDGDEMKIRSVLYHLLKLGYQDSEWPFESIEPFSYENLGTEEMKMFDLYYPTDIRKKSIQMYIAMTSVREKYQKEMRYNITEDLEPILQLLLDSTKHMDFFIENLMSDFSRSLSENEKLGLSYFIQIGTSQTISNEKKLLIISKLKEQFNPFYRFSSFALKETLRSHNVKLTSNDFDIHVYHFILYLITQQLMGTLLFELQEFDLNHNIDLTKEKNQTLLQTIRSGMCDEAYERIFENQENFEVFVGYLISIIESYDVNTVKLFFSTTKSLSSAFYLKKQLTDFFSESKITFTESFDDADLIITDNFNTHNDEKEFFVVTSFGCQKTLNSLIQRIMNLST